MILTTKLEANWVKRKAEYFYDIIENCSRDTDRFSTEVIYKWASCMLYGGAIMLAIYVIYYSHG